MSKYTTLLRWPVEQALDDLNLSHSEESWPRIYGVVGLDDYPIFDESHRQVLNDKIIRAYYFREIGFETMGLFRWKLRQRMFEIMPYWNKMYESESMVTDPMLSKKMDFTEEWTRDEDIGIARTGSEDRSGKSSAASTASSTSDDRSVFQDTPMNGLDTGAIESMDYATTVTMDDGSSSSSSSNTGESSAKSSTKDDSKELGDYEGTRKHREEGFDGSQSDLLLTYRKTLVNIDLEIVRSLDDLFMRLW